MDHKIFHSPRPPQGETRLQPFPRGTGGSANFRIPAIAALRDGTLAAACDARWDHTGDGGGLDTILSRSSDGGNTWRYSFPNYLGDNGDALDPLSTSFIDPALATDGETLWMLVDLYPAGIALNTARYRPVPGGSGFDSPGRLRLRRLDPVPIGGPGYGEAAAKGDYDCFLDLKSLTIYDRSGKPPEGYRVDPHYNITAPDGSVTNLFCADAPFKPYPTGYLYLTCSRDGGATWSAPELLDLKRPEEEVLLVGPGNGACQDGRVIFSAYEHTLGFERCCLIWRDGEGWHRSKNATTDTWSSEGAPVALEDGRVRLFYRDGFQVLRYTDYRYQEGAYIPVRMEMETAAPKTTRNQLSAVRVGDEIFVSTATGKDGSRTNGVIHVFKLEEDGSMTLTESRPIKPGFYAYSSLTALPNGDLALLCESAMGEITFRRVGSLGSSQRQIGIRPGGRSGASI